MGQSISKTVEARSGIGATSAMADSSHQDPSARSEHLATSPASFGGAVPHEEPKSPPMSGEGAMRSPHVFDLDPFERDSVSSQSRGTSLSSPPSEGSSSASEQDEASRSSSEVLGFHSGSASTADSFLAQSEAESGDPRAIPPLMTPSPSLSRPASSEWVKVTACQETRQDPALAAPPALDVDALHDALVELPQRLSRPARLDARSPRPSRGSTPLLSPPPAAAQLNREAIPSIWRWWQRDGGQDQACDDRGEVEWVGPSKSSLVDLSEGEQTPAPLDIAPGLNRTRRRAHPALLLPPPDVGPGSFGRIDNLSARGMSTLLPLPVSWATAERAPLDVPAAHQARTSAIRSPSEPLDEVR